MQYLTVLWSRARLSRHINGGDVACALPRLVTVGDMTIMAIAAAATSLYMYLTKVVTDDQ